MRRDEPSDSGLEFGAPQIRFGMPFADPPPTSGPIAHADRLTISTEHIWLTAHHHGNMRAVCVPLLSSLCPSASADPRCGTALAADAMGAFDSVVRIGGQPIEAFSAGAPGSFSLTSSRRSLRRVRRGARERVVTLDGGFV